MYIYNDMSGFCLHCYISGPFASVTIVSGSVLIGRFSLFLGQCSPNYPGCEYSNFSVSLFIQGSVEFGTERYRLLEVHFLSAIADCSGLMLT